MASKCLVYCHLGSCIQLEIYFGWPINTSAVQHFSLLSTTESTYTSVRYTSSSLFGDHNGSFGFVSCSTLICISTACFKRQSALLCDDSDMLRYRQGSQLSDAFCSHSAYIVVMASEELNVACDHVHHEISLQTLQLREGLKPTIVPGQLQLGEQMSSLLRGRVWSPSAYIVIILRYPSRYSLVLSGLSVLHSRIPLLKRRAMLWTVQQICPVDGCECWT